VDWPDQRVEGRDRSEKPSRARPQIRCGTTRVNQRFAVYSRNALIFFGAWSRFQCARQRSLMSGNSPLNLLARDPHR